jgi:uncharacterized membrane protein
MFMKNPESSLQVAKLVYIFTLMPTLLLPSAHSAAQSIANPRIRGMTTMQDHHSHPQSRETVPRPAMDELSGTPFTFTSVDVPGASNTIATGINARGAIVGIYYDSAGIEHGFLRKNGNFSTVDVPGSLVGVSGTLQTEANGINAAGEIVGDYFAPPGAPGAPACTADTPPLSPQCRRGFLYRKGQFSDVLVPGKKGSIPNAISPNGTIYGCDHDDDYLTSMVGFGRIGVDTFITLDADGGELKNPTESVVGSMNNGATPDGSTIVGLYVDPPDQNGQYHGYIVHDGTFQRYDVPGSTLTQTWGINPAADFVGLYDDANGEHGFVQNRGAATPITIDVPSGPPFNATLTDAFAINSAGSIVGLYIDATGTLHGYMAERQKHDE